jgi:tripartite-type tricarboxylate transporter receptor subunit TctC
MSDLLDRTIEAHGGLERWRGVRAIDVVFNFSGGLLDLKGFPGHHRPAVSVDAFKPRAVLQRLSGQLKVAYGGNGTPQHIGIELFKMMAGVDLSQVPYLGSAPALADLLGGQVQVMFDPMPSSIGDIRAGKLIPLAVTTPTRSEALPDVPAMSDFVPGYEVGSWFGIGAPANAPADIVNRLNIEVNAGLADPKIDERLADLGATAVPGSPADFGAFIARETEKYGKVIRAAKITVR